MDQSGVGAGNQGQSSNQVGPYQNLDLQQWMRQREDLRQMKAVIEDAERRMEMGMVSQLSQQQMGPTQLGLPVPVPYAYHAPGLAPPAPNVFTDVRSPPINESARIVEIESSANSPNGSSTMPSSNFTTRNTSPQALSHIHSQSKTSYPSVSQPAMSNMAPYYGRQSQQWGQQRHYDISFPTSTASRTQKNQYISSGQYQHSQSQAINATYHAPRQVSSQQSPATSHPPAAAQNHRSASTTHATAVSMHAGSQSNATIQPSLHNPPGMQNGVEPRHSVGQQDPKSQSLGEHTPLKREAHTLVPVSSSSTVAPSILPSSQVHDTAASDPNLSALSDLNTLLAGHDQWSDDASSRILNTVLGTSNKLPTSETGSSSQVAVHPTQESTVSLAPSHRPSEPVLPLLPQTEISQIMGAHESSSATGGLALPKDSSYVQSNPKLAHLTSQPQMPPHYRHDRDVNDVVPPSVMAGVSTPHTPVRTGKFVTATTPSSMNANRNTLAQDIIRALQPPSTKRKRADTQGEERRDGNVSVESPSAKKSRTAVSGTSRTDVVSGVTNNTEHVRHPREGAGTTPAAPVQQPLTPGFDARSVQAHQSFPSNSQGHPLSYYSEAALQWRHWLPRTHAQATSRNNTYAAWQSSPQYMMSPWSLKPSSGAPLTWAPMPTSSAPVPPTKARPLAPLPPKQTPNQEPVSIPSIPVPTPVRTHTLASAQTPRQSGTAVLNGSVSSPNATVPRTPLFLPSSGSLSSRTSASPSPSRKPSGLVPVVELGPSLAKLKSKAHLVKGRNFPKPDATVASTSIDSVSDTEPFFGKPTGALAAASISELVAKPSRSQRTLRPSRSQAYVLIPAVDTRAWYIYRRPLAKGDATHIPQKEHLSERRRPMDEDSIHVQDFARRLIRRPCLWKNCHAILDSTEKLLKHVKIVHGKQAEDQLYRCRWKECLSTGCYAESEKFISHLQWHVTARLFCGYEDCDFQTRLAERLAEHVAEDHDEIDTMRPIAVPSALVAPELPAPVDTLPSYMSVPLQVTGRPITKERHQRIGPWVLHRIFGKVDFKKGAVSAAVPLRSQRLERQTQPVPEEILLDGARLPFKVQDEYELMRKEAPARSFGSLMPLPHVIDDIDVEEDGYLVDDTANHVQSGPGSVGTPPIASEHVMGEDSLPGMADNAVAERAEADEDIQNAENSVRAVKEDIDSREVEGLL